MKRGKALIIDDDADVREVIAQFARRLGYEVTVVGSGADFRAAFDEGGADAVVLDIVMPDEDGIELLRWLATRRCRARVVIASGHDPIYSRSALRLAEADGLDIVALRKPLMMRDLEAAFFGMPCAGGANTV